MASSFQKEVAVAFYKNVINNITDKALAGKVAVTELNRAD